MRVSRFAAAVLALAIPGLILAADGPDPIGAELHAARAAYDQAVDAARQTLLGEFDTWIENAREAGKLDVLRVLNDQKAAFQASDTLPAAGQLQTARARYESSVRTARRTLAAALKKAEITYTKADQLDQAQDAQDERSGLEDTLSASTRKKGPEAPDALFQPETRWMGRAVIITRDTNGQLIQETADTELYVKARDGNRFTFRFIGKHLGSGAVIERDHEGLFGRVERSGKTVRRRFTWGEGPGLREGWVSGNTLTAASISGDNRSRSTGRATLVPAP